jgi:hypothetical protein
MFFIGVSALFVFAFDVVWKHVAQTPELFGALIQVNSYAYASAVIGLFIFHFDRNPPESLEVKDTGVEFRFQSGRREFVTWAELEGETNIYDTSLDPGTGGKGQITLSASPGYASL